MGGHYERRSVPVVRADTGESVEAITYVADVVGGLRPTRAYLAHLLAGGDLLPPGYWQQLQVTPDARLRVAGGRLSTCPCLTGVGPSAPYPSQMVAEADMAALNLARRIHSVLLLAGTVAFAVPAWLPIPRPERASTMRRSSTTPTVGRCDWLGRAKPFIYPGTTTISVAISSRPTSRRTGRRFRCRSRCRRGRSSV